MTTYRFEDIVEIRELNQYDDVAAFCSGDDDLDRWFKTRAKDNRRRGFGTTSVAVENEAVLGFISTSAASVERDRVKRGQGPFTWPALLIARMAVSNKHQKRGIGKQLIAYAFSIADAQYKLSGCAAVIVDAKPSAVDFYRQFGFRDLLVLPSDSETTANGPTKMFLPIATVLLAIEEASREAPLKPATTIPSVEAPSRNSSSS